MQLQIIKVYFVLTEIFMLSIMAASSFKSWDSDKYSLIEQPGYSINHLHFFGIQNTKY